MEQVKLNIITKAIDEKKGEDIQVYDVTGKNPFYDLLVVSGQNVHSPDRNGIEGKEKNQRSSCLR